MRRRSKRSVSLFAVAVAAGLSAATAFAQYYPPTPPAPLFPVANNPDLQVINAALSSLKPGETLGLDPVAGSAAILPADYTNAVALAVTQAIKGTLPGGTPNTVTVATLTQAAALLRPALIGSMSKVVAAAIVLNAPPADQNGYIRDLTYQFALVGGKTAPAVVTGVITSILTVKGNTNPIDPNDVTDITTQAIDAAPQLAGNCIAAAIAATKKTFTTATAEDNVVTAGVNAVISNGAASSLNAVATATMTSVVKSALIGVRPDAAKEVATTFLNAAYANVSSQSGQVQRDTAIQLVAGLAAGAGATYSANVGQGADASSFTSYKTVMDETIAGYNAAITGLTAPLAASQFASYLTTTKPTDTDAAIAGAVAAHAKFASSILSSALQALTGNTNNSSTVSSIITAAVLASPLQAANDAKAIATVGVQGTTPGQILSAIMQGTTPDQFGLVELSLFKGLGGVPNATVLNDVVTNAIHTAESTQNGNTIATLTYDAAKASKQSVNVVNNALAAASLSTNPVEAAQIVAAATAADLKNAGAIKLAADGALTGNALALADLAANLTLSIINPPKPPAGTPKDPLVFFEQENLALSSATTADQRLAIVYAVTQANPKGTSAIVATALASAKTSGASEEAAIIAAAVAANPKAAPNIKAAADTAIYVAAGTSDLFNYIGNQVTAYPTLAADIVTGATAADPGEAHVIGHAVGFADPLGAGKVVPALFSFSSLNAPKIGGGAGDPVARAAAITAGLVDGLIESHNSKTDASLKAVVSAAVKASITLTGLDPNFQQVGTNGSASGAVSTGPAGVITGYVSQYAKPTSTDFVDAVLNAAAKSAKAYVLQIAQAAAEAAAYVYDTHNATPAGAGTYAGIVNALNGVNPTLTSAQIRAAVDFGIAQAQSLAGGNLAAAGAGAAGVMNYTTHPVTGNFVTSILDL